MKKILSFISIWFLFMIQAEATSIQIDCPTTAIPGETITCKVVANTNKSISGVESHIQVSSHIEYINFVGDTIWEDASENGIIYLYTDTNKTGNFSLGTITAKIKEDAESTQNESILIYNNLFYDDAFQELEIGNTSTTIDILSTNTYLKNLTILTENITPNFQEEITSYSLTTEKDQITIEANPMDEKATISGTGTHSLKEGTNTFQITVTSEDGNTRTYTITVSKPKKAQPEETKEETNSNETQNTETTTSTKTEESSTEKETTLPETIDLRLKTLNILGHTINFSSDIYEYQLEVTKDEKDLSIEATSFEEQAIIAIEGNLDLKQGYNKITIKVTKDENILEYIIHVNKEQEEDYLLKSLVIEEYDISFSPNIFHYSITIGEETKLKINTIANNPDATVKITGNENLKNGSTITITVNKDNIETEYTIDITTKDNQKETEVLLKNNNHTIILGITAIVLSIIFIIIRLYLKKENKKIEINMTSKNRPE